MKKDIWDPQEPTQHTVSNMRVKTNPWHHNYKKGLWNGREGEKNHHRCLQLQILLGEYL